MMTTISRRTFLVSSAAGIGTLAMPYVQARASNRTITVGGYFDMADHFTAHWIRPFEEATGARVLFDPGNSVNQLSKMRAEQKNPAHSVMLMDESYIPLAKREDLVVELDQSRMPNMASVDQRFWVSGGYGVGISMHLVALAYHTDIAAPESWEAMWDPSMRQQVAIPSIQHNWFPTFVMAAHLKSGKPLAEAQYDVDAGFEKFRELKPNLLTSFNNAANAIAMLEQGEVKLIGVISSKNVFPFLEKGVPIALTTPKEGSFALLNCAVLVKNGPEPELAAEFLNFGLSERVQNALAEHAAAGPVNMKATLPDKLKGIIPASAEEYAAIHDLDWAFFQDNLPQLTDRWNGFMAE